jgi:branched-chain amino acid transport system substrate-binding protein
LIRQPLHRPSRTSRPLRGALALLWLGLLALLATGCGGGDPAKSAVTGSQLAIYSSVPLEGPDRSAALDVMRGEELALREARGSAGGYRVKLVTLDAATEKAARWDPAQISENARAAAKDPAAIAYLGEFHAGSSAIAVPLLNEAGLLQVSPTDSAMALTRRTLAVPDSPEKYYPKAQDYGRTFARMVPDDRRQAAAQLEYMRQERVRRAVLLSDEDPIAIGYAMELKPLARRYGISMTERQEVDPHQQDPSDLVQKVQEARADAVFYAGEAHDGAVRLWQALAAAEPSLKLFAPGSVVDKPFIDAVGAGAAESTYVTRPVLGLRAYPPAADRFVRTFSKAYGRAPAPEALYGYEAMNAVLAAIGKAGREAGERTLDRADVVAAFRGIRRKATVLGDYAILPGGDTTLDRFGAYRIVGGELRYTHPLAG